MDASTQPISPLRRRFIDDMTVRKLDPKTQANYLRSVKRFADFLGRSPAGASAEDLRRFSTLITSQLPVEHWHDIIGDPTLADAILDRLVHSACRITLKGESLRKRRARPLTDPTTAA